MAVASVGAAAVVSVRCDGAAAAVAATASDDDVVAATDAWWEPGDVALALIDAEAVKDVAPPSRRLEGRLNRSVPWVGRSRSEENCLVELCGDTNAATVLPGDVVIWGGGAAVTTGPLLS